MPQSADTPATGPQDTPSQPSRKPKPKRPNYNQIHAKPVPLTVHPLPAFHPSNPISLLRLSYIYITHLFAPPSSHPPSSQLYTGLFSPRTRSVHVTDPEHVRALWEMGFWGKGSLSRSEPSWIERERANVRKAREGNGGGLGGGGAEGATARRREERRLFKLERARVEREKVERQRAVEGGRVVDEEVAEVAEEKTSVPDDVEPTTTDAGARVLPHRTMNGSVEEGKLHDSRTSHAVLLQMPTPQSGSTPPSQSTATATSIPQTNTTSSRSPQKDVDDYGEPDPAIDDQEHLQLTLEEAFFLTYSLGVLASFPPPPALNPAPFHPGPQPYSTTDLLFLCCHHSSYPSADVGSGIAPDDQFLLNYVVYHHFRSLGWVVRPGMKFGCDYLLYNRGPVFSHAEFAVLIIPSYTHRYWNTPGGHSRRRIHHPSEPSDFSTRASSSASSDDGARSAMLTAGGGGGGKDWWFLHCVNRVQSQVKKSLVLCYVDIPSPWDVGLDDEWDVDVDVGRLLRGYRVREFVVRRWVVNRMRD